MLRRFYDTPDSMIRIVFSEEARNIMQYGIHRWTIWSIFTRWSKDLQHPPQIVFKIMSVTAVFFELFTELLVH
jgi:vacuolar-type H+-ATPase subunit C/Vma6